MSSIKLKARAMLWLFIFIFALALGIFIVNNQIPLQIAASEICQRVLNQIYLSDEQILPWYQECLKESKKIAVQDSAEQVMLRLNAHFAALKVSHLGIYNSDQVKKVWQSEYKTTGIESHYLDGEVVVIDVLPKSPAQKIGIKRGDLIKKINNQLASVDMAESESGLFEISRNSKILKFELTTETLQVDDQIKLNKIDKDTLQIIIPSFRAEFFEKENWLEMISEIKKNHRVIVDLRKNIGGDLIAGMRFLSPFLCRPQTIGSLLKPRKIIRYSTVLSDQKTNDEQMELISKNDEVILSSFADYGCLQAQVIVLVGPQTASTAEIVAQALYEKLQAKILGSTSSGQCLIGIWYPLPKLGTGFEISIPEALFKAVSGKIIEGYEGVHLDKTLYENLNDYIHNQDSLLKQSLGYFSN